MFTFPIMVCPVNEIVEGKLERVKWFKKPSHNDSNDSTRLSKIGIYISRAILVIGLAVLASCVPTFGVFVSLVGSTVCALTSFVLPAIFHLELFGSSLHLWQKTLDFIVLFCGLLFAVYGTHSTIAGL